MYILWKGSLNNDGHRFHQYQQNEQSLIERKNKRPWYMVLAWDKQNM
jgi:hypothetical protein